MQFRIARRAIQSLYTPLLFERSSSSRRKKFIEYTSHDSHDKIAARIQKIIALKECTLNNFRAAVAVTLIRNHWLSTQESAQAHKTGCKSFNGPNTG